MNNLSEKESFDNAFIIALIKAVNELTEKFELMKNDNIHTDGYYRNKDLKEKFRLSENTIKKYRILGFLPYSKIGEVYVYPIKMMNKALSENGNLNQKFRN